jgi:hypothetical protein
MSDFNHKIKIDKRKKRFAVNDYLYFTTVVDFFLFQYKTKKSACCEVAICCCYSESSYSLPYVFISLGREEGKKKKSLVILFVLQCDLIFLVLRMIFFFFLHLVFFSRFLVSSFVLFVFLFFLTKKNSNHPLLCVRNR